jgi:hypothetical protein
MNEQTKLEQSELEKLQQQQQKYTQTLLEIGSTELIIDDLKKRLKNAEEEKNNLFNDVIVLQEQAKDFQVELAKKYGTIDVDLNTGEYKVISQ